MRFLRESKRAGITILIITIMFTMLGNSLFIKSVTAAQTEYTFDDEEEGWRAGSSGMNVISEAGMLNIKVNGNQPDLNKRIISPKINQFKNYNVIDIKMKANNPYISGVSLYFTDETDKILCDRDKIPVAVTVPVTPKDTITDYKISFVRIYTMERLNFPCRNIKKIILSFNGNNIASGTNISIDSIQLLSDPIPDDIVLVNDFPVHTVDRIDELNDNQAGWHGTSSNYSVAVENGAINVSIPKGLSNVQIMSNTVLENIAGYDAIEISVKSSNSKCEGLQLYFYNGKGQMVMKASGSYLSKSATFNGSDKEQKLLFVINDIRDQDTDKPVDDIQMIGFLPYGKQMAESKTNIVIDKIIYKAAKVDDKVIPPTDEELKAVAATDFDSRDFNWAHRLIAGIEAKDISEDTVLTNEEFAILLVGALRLPYATYDGSLHDVPEAAPFAYAVQSMFKAGLIDDGKFPIGTQITSENALDILERAWSKVFGRTGKSGVVLDYNRTFTAKDTVETINQFLDKLNIKIMPENMILNGFITSEKDDRKVITANKKDATAEFTFNGESGYYAIDVSYYDQKVAKDSFFHVYVNNEEIDFWRTQFDDGQFHIRNSSDARYIEKGDIFKITGSNFEQASIAEYICFQPVFQPEFKSGILARMANKEVRGWKYNDFENGERVTYNVCTGGLFNYDNVSTLDDVSYNYSMNAQRIFRRVDTGKIQMDYSFLLDRRKVNIAASAKITTSGTDKSLDGYGIPKYDPMNVVDGTLGAKYDFGWESDDGSPAWIQFEWPSVHNVDNFVLYLGSSGNKGFASQYRIEWWDGLSWQLFGNADVKDNKDALKFHNTQEPVNTTKIRIITNNNKLGLNEIWISDDLKQTSKVDGVFWSLRDGLKDSIKFYTKDGNIYVAGNNEEEQLLLENYYGNTWDGIHIEMDLDKGIADVYFYEKVYDVNSSSGSCWGITDSTEATFLNNITPRTVAVKGILLGCKSIDRFCIDTPAKDVVKIAMPYLCITGGYEVFDEFAAATDGKSDLRWKINGEASTTRFMTGYHYDMYSYCVKSGDISREFNPIENKLTAEWKFYLPDVPDGVDMALTSNGSEVVKLITKDGNLCTVDADGKCNVLWEKYLGNVWYDVRVEVNVKDKKANWYINNIKKGEGFPVSTQSIDGIKFTTMPGKYLWIDDVHVLADIYKTRVPAPRKVDTGNYLVGVQACDIQTSGIHTGQMAIASFDNRKPLYGWYDEYNREAADWQIKAMAENGIGAYFTTQYRSKHANGNPVKTLPMSEPLDAFLSSPYASTISFSFTSLISFADEKDFMNVVDYWIEHYFKNPVYTRVDNKLFVGIYNSALFNSQMKGNGKAVLDKARDHIKAAVGCDDVIFCTNDWWTDGQQAKQFLSYGFNYAYAYSWFQRNTFNTQSKLISLQRDWTTYGQADAIPVVSQGFGNEPWNFSADSRKVSTSLKDWYMLLDWMKNSLMPSYPADKLGNKMFMLDNWNELNEGHFVVPSKMAGFGYLNIVRKWFGKDNEPHGDIIPKDIGLNGAYDYMYGDTITNSPDLQSQFLPN